MERIRQDRQKAPTQIQPLLAYLETHLFDPDLDANQLKRACGVRDNSLPIYFHHALSLPPYAYIEDCRLEVACRLLSDSSLKIWQIAQLLGYSTLQVFSRAFHRWSGLRPSVFRRRARLEAKERAQPAAGAGALAAQDGDLLIDVSTMRKATTGGLGKDEADELARRLAQLYPESFGPTPAEGAMGQGGQLSAEEAWTLLQVRSLRERRDFVLGRSRVASIELFHLLVEKGIEISRGDPQHGLEVADLALACLDALAGSLDPVRLSQLEAEGWSCVANARYLVDDFAGSEQAIATAEAALRIHNDPVTRAELRFVKSSLRMLQRRMGEAMELADRAVSLASSLHQPKLQVRYLLHRANLLYLVGRAAEGIPDLWQAHGLIDQVDDPYLKAAVYQGLSLFLTLEGQHREAACYLPAARALCQELEIEKVFCYLEWTEGLVAREVGQGESAEAHFQTARAGFYEQKQSYLGSLAALDLAILYADQGRVAETLKLSAEVISVFEGLQIQREALMALQLLRQAISTREISAATLRKIRSVVGRSQPPSSP